MAPTVADVVRVTPDVHWHALEDDVVVGRGYALHRPDGRVFVSVDTWRDDVFALLAEAMAGDLARPVFTLVAEDDVEHLGRWSALGFVDNRREDELVLPTDPAASGLAGVVPPSGYTLVPADGIDEERLRRLDQALRRDVPGSEGWVTTPEAFHAQTFDPRFFDPETYVVALHADDGAAGLARVWRGTRHPRLGLVGVLAGHRRRGLARHVMGELTSWAMDHEATTGLLAASAEGASLYTSLGWETRLSMWSLMSARP